jgi:hypothetical protein
MFDQLFQSPDTIIRHYKAPHADLRQQYLLACKQQGDPTTTLAYKATAQLRIAQALGGYLCRGRS